MMSLVPRVLSILLVALLLSGCDAAGPQSQPDPEASPAIELTAAQQDVLDGTGTTFGLDLFGTLNEEKGADQNVVVSPFSVSTALTMTLNGARDSTRRALKQALDVSDHSVREINGAHRRLAGALPELDTAVTLQSANSLWAQNGYPVKAAFADTLRSVFGAEARRIDFASPEAADRINGWVADQTEDMIQTLVKDRDLNANTVLALLNALYFEAPWQTAFDEEQTEDASFARPNRPAVQVPMMHRTDSLRYGSTDRAKMVDLPYGNEAFRMTVIVPEEETTARALATDLDAATWTRWLDGLEPQRVQVRLPRFDVTVPRANLNEVLRTMGLGIIFRGDFSGLSPKNPVVEKVLHKAAVAVDEDGTEASAATAVIFREGAPPTVRADRPFLFAIREAQTGALLFLGRIADPTA